MPLLALTYAMHFCGVQTTKIYTECMEKMEVRRPATKQAGLGSARY